MEIQWTFTELFSTCHFPRNKKLIGDKHQINLSVTQMLRAAKKSDAPIEEVFSIFISHEVLHAVLQEYISKEAWDTLDNICDYKLQRQNINTNDDTYFYSSMKRWIGGLLWE